ncbi:hypothetical protein N1851_023079 [Merluccius polli]|uniref:Integrase catalytic domain-containing protein n=1 Tax=Merluccius polli TaxID=89951 RepID=A0AA47MGR8_MERPO|nr:hypothetical protein N1851_023079 [Merluccius polli]
MEQHCDEKNELSREDEQFLKIISESAELKDGHYHLKLPFRNTNVSMPNNKHIAQQRAQHLLKRFEKNTEFFIEYKAFVDEMMSKGYAEAIPQGELLSETGKQWYLPHHGVYHPRKRKLRVVFDCAAVFGGTSLNKELLQGPDLTNTLLGVLLHFRQGPTAFITDVEGMFHQVRVAKEDVNFLRFLWWPGGDISKNLVEHRMAVHIFGAVSSPSCATFALLKTADDNQNQYSEEVINTVRHNFYVDDCLKAVNSTEQALFLYQQLTELCAKGGFHLNKWISNDRTVLSAISEKDRAKELRTLDLSKEQLPMERALGAQWNVERDCFTFSITIKPHQMTRRGILSIVCSIYDPLGFLAPITLVAKQIVQGLCKLKLTWDERVPHDIAQTWKTWISSLHLLDSLGVNRSFFPSGFGHFTSAQLHHFCDASEVGYGAVSYLRLTNSKGTMENMDVIPDGDPEIKQEVSVHATSVQSMKESCPTNKLLSYFSNWMDLKRAIAWILKIKDTLKQRHDGKTKTNIHVDIQTKDKKPKVKKKRSTYLSVTDLEKAEVAIISFVQQQHFPEEISNLTAGKNIKKSSHLYKLDPTMVDGVLRVGGRLSKAALPEELKHPVILPKSSNISELILRHVHVKIGHSGRNHMLSSLRRQFWIPHANALARKICRECMTCRRLHQKPGEQKMSDLPPERLAVDLPPFSLVGMDYFGPIEVKRGRNTVKRYGVIFTCLTCHAVHLEVAHTMDTDSCINAIRRFICRRGQVKEIKSDNGTNFISANRELKQALQNLNQNKIQNTLRQDGIKLTFNPPHGAHHGGVWERLIQQVKRILCSVTKQQIVDDEALNTIFCEGKPILPPGLFDKRETYGRRRWKQVQYISDLFWKRWAKEYLPTIQQRQKWNRPHRSFSIGDLVLLIDESAPRNSWPLGRIIDTVCRF